MGRKTQLRYVKNPPENHYFPGTIDKRSSDSFQNLTLAEFESMRLKHYVNLPQQQAASVMSVSQPTFSRILESAHRKITKALIEGKRIRVFGGNFVYSERFIGYGCLTCNEEWEDKQASKERKLKCPNCGSDKTYFLTREPI